MIQPVINMVDLLLSVNVTDDKIKSYLNSLDSTIKIIEEKLDRIEKKKR